MADAAVVVVAAAAVEEQVGGTPLTTSDGPEYSEATVRSEEKKSERMDQVTSKILYMLCVLNRVSR